MAFDFFEKKSIFDILNEADDDNTDQGSTDTFSDTSGDNNDTGDDNTSDNNDSTPEEGEEDFGSDNDFDIDSSLDDEDGVSDDSSSSDVSSSSSSSTESEDEEPIKNNTDIFSALSKEEQSIKIKELKRLFNELYLSCNDMLEKINDINPDEDTLVPLEKISSAMYSLKNSIGEYIQSHFAIKSYIENDVMFNRYLIILDSIKTILEQISSELEEKIQKDNKN